MFKKGIIVSRPKIAVNKSTQISLNFPEIKSSEIDTSLAFNKSLCDSLEKHLNIVKQKGNYKGLSIAIGSIQKGFWKSSVGESGTEMPLTTDTKFHALSLGKIFTSALVLRLIEEGFLSLNDKVDKWFPQCPRANEITINNLLNHTSGIKTYETLYEFALNDQNNFSEEELTEMAFAYKIDNAPNTYFSYSNTGFVMLGMIIQKVTGKSLEQLFNENFIFPLNLKNTSFCSKNNLEMDNIRGYIGDTLSENTQWPLTYATGPFISTPTDIILLYNYLLSGHFLSDSSMNSMLSEMNIWLYDPNAYYGKGISIFKDLPSGIYLGHTGGVGSFKTCVFYNIENKIFVSVFSNSNAFDIEPAMFYMNEKLIDLIK
jgi:D-alanyl-D-alanine carboxypeptidase